MKIESLLTAKEVAEIMRMTPEQIYRLAGRGILPSKRIGAAVRFAPSEIRKYLGLKETN